jgi:hypothetical protein
VATLAQTQHAADGSVPAEVQAQARQTLKKVLVGPIDVVPDFAGVEGTWAFFGYCRFEGVLAAGSATVRRRRSSTRTGTRASTRLTATAIRAARRSRLRFSAGG